eukprot:g31804.t1
MDAQPMLLDLMEAAKTHQVTDQLTPLLEKALRGHLEKGGSRTKPQKETDAVKLLQISLCAEKLQLSDVRVKAIEEMKRSVEAMKNKGADGLTELRTFQELAESSRVWQSMPTLALIGALVIAVAALLGKTVETTHFQHLRRKGAFFLTGPPPLQQRLAAAFGKDHEGLGRPEVTATTLAPQREGQPLRYVPNSMAQSCLCSGLSTWAHMQANKTIGCACDKALEKLKECIYGHHGCDARHRIT